MIGVSLVMALLFFGAFLWSMKSGQNDDLYTPSLRILLEDEHDKIPLNSDKSTNPL